MKRLVVLGLLGVSGILFARAEKAEIPVGEAVAAPVATVTYTHRKVSLNPALRAVPVVEKQIRYQHRKRAMKPVPFTPTMDPRKAAAKKAAARDGS